MSLREMANAAQRGIRFHLTTSLPLLGLAKNRHSLNALIYRNYLSSFP